MGSRQKNTLSLSLSIYTYIYIYIYMCVVCSVYMYIYIYIYRQREREREREAIGDCHRNLLLVASVTPPGPQPTHPPRRGRNPPCCYCRYSPVALANDSVPPASPSLVRTRTHPQHPPDLPPGCWVDGGNLRKVTASHAIVTGISFSKLWKSPHLRNLVLQVIR